MSISVTQEEAKFRPVTIVIDDERTVNMLRYAIHMFYTDMVSSEIIRCIHSINSVEDYQATRADLSSIAQHLSQICNKK